MLTLCRGCGHPVPEDILEYGYCPGCADDNLCAGCRRPWDPAGGLCDDCLEAEREALGDDRCAGCGRPCDPSFGICDECEDIKREITNEESDQC